MELCKKQALLLEGIYRGRMDNGTAQAGVIPVARIVRHDEDDVGPGLFSWCAGRSKREGQGHQDEGDLNEGILWCFHLYLLVFQHFSF